MTEEKAPVSPKGRRRRGIRENRYFTVMVIGIVFLFRRLIGCTYEVEKTVGRVAA